MKKMIPLLMILLNGYLAMAQEKICDMEMDFPIQEDLIIVPFGDTLKFKVRIINNGPDDFEEGDEVLFKLVGTSIPSFTDQDNIPSGTFKDFNYFSEWAHEDQTEDRLVEYCFELLASESYVDPNSSNNTKCIQIVYQGNPVSIKEKKETTSPMIVYPNPLKEGVLHLKDFPPSTFYTISIRDFLGRVLKEFSFIDSLNELSLDLSDFNNGLYLIEWNDGFQSISTPLVIEQ